MVPPSSDRISRVPPYLFVHLVLLAVFAYGAITRYGRTFQSVRLTTKTKEYWLFRISLATTFGISVDFFSCGYLDVSVHRVRFTWPMYSAMDTLAGGFPHSDISGSKLVCQLPGAFRRLPRPSSPVIAKASTTCTYSLDPITSLSLLSIRQSLQVEFSHLCRIPIDLDWSQRFGAYSDPTPERSSFRIILRYIDTITTRISFHVHLKTLPLSKLLTSSRLLKNDSRYAFTHITLTGSIANAKFSFEVIWR